MRKVEVTVNPEKLDIQILKFAEIDLPGRQVRRSHGVEIGAIELNQDILLPQKLAQADVFSCRARKRKVWGFVPDLHRRSQVGSAQHAGQQYAGQEQAFY